jgi:predicted transcriptional regulator of viral defense system
MSREPSKTPSWERLFAIAVHQEGMFTTSQGAEAGYSLQLLAYHVQAGRFARVRRGTYRIVHFKTGGYGEFVDAWLWSGRKGVLSHQTALGLHGLADLLRWPIHLTVPKAWRSRRLEVPEDVRLHYADVPRSDRTWRGPVPVTSPRRTFADGGAASLSAEALRQALDGALEREWMTRSQVAAIARWIPSNTDLMRST